MSRRLTMPIVMVWAVCSAMPSFSQTQSLPASADPSRMSRPGALRLSKPPATPISIPAAPVDIPLPSEVAELSFTLQTVTLEGVKTFSQEEMADIYRPLIGKDITMLGLWDIADDITHFYRSQGYFLSRAYIPAQEITGGGVTIRVVEGYIGDIELEGKIRSSGLLQQHMRDLMSRKPLTSRDLESFLLRINDLPDASLIGTLQPLPGAPPGAVKLVLTATPKKGSGLVSVNNSGSRFLGPYQSLIGYQDSFIPMQQTTLFTSASLPMDEMRYGAIEHTIPLMPNWWAKLSASHARAQPGSSLEISDITSTSNSLSGGVFYRPIYQRDEHLILSILLDGRNTKGYILSNNILSSDCIRVVRAGMDYETDDRFNGLHSVELTLSKGLEILGSSRKGDLFLSRAMANPDFTSLAADYRYEKRLNRHFSAVGGVAAQFSSAPLFSAEEFGFGGSQFGRAYDPSDITGDHGVAGSLELRYHSIRMPESMSLIPYAFYDIGKVWNEDLGSDSFSAASAGVGVRITHECGIQANFGVAFPLTRDVDKPLYGDRNDPRFLMEITKRF